MSERSSRVRPEVSGDVPLVVAMVEWQAAVMRLGALDPLTTEAVRLRCATHHDCHT